MFFVFPEALEQHHPQHTRQSDSLKIERNLANIPSEEPSHSSLHSHGVKVSPKASQTTIKKIKKKSLQKLCELSRHGETTGYEARWLMRASM